MMLRWSSRTPRSSSSLSSVSVTSSEGLMSSRWCYEDEENAGHAKFGKGVSGRECSEITITALHNSPL